MATLPTNPRFIDLTGHEYGRWTVLGPSENFDPKTAYWRCRCDCGTEKDVSRNHLRSGHSTSCGCYKTEAASEANSARLEGQRFGRLTVLRRAGSQRTHDKRASSALWECVCDCGALTKVTSYKLTSGYVKSCGCLFLDAVTTHGKSRSRVYGIWQHMMTRCSDKASGRTRADYYERGIRVCERWHTFENFYTDMGDPRPDQSLDRINPNANYEPSNCRWANRKQQAGNTRRNKMVNLNGKEMLLTDAIALLREMAKPLHPRKRTAE